MKSKKPKGPTKIELVRKLKEMEAQLASTYHFASVNLPKAEGLGGSAVILELTALGGRELIHPVAIRGGLSPDTISAIRRDIARSFDEAVLFKPVRDKES